MIHGKQLEFEEMEKKDNLYISRNVEQYVREVSQFNREFLRDEVVGKLGSGSLGNGNLGEYLAGNLKVKEEEKQENDEENYDTNLNLNYKKFK